MKKLYVPLFIILAATAFAFTSSASAAEGKAMTPQQEKMANCAHESKGMKGDEHKKFMSDCLKGKTHEMKVGAAAESSAAAGTMKSEEHKAKSKAHKAEEKTKSETTAQQEKMKTCNSEAKEKKLKGKDRKSFMSECLKGG